MSRDIDLIISAVREQLPEVDVQQSAEYRPGDDDGMWFFSLEGNKGEIQLESSSGNCPFMVESDAMSRSDQATQVATVPDAVKSVTDYLTSLKEKRTAVHRDRAIAKGLNDESPQDPSRRIFF